MRALERNELKATRNNAGRWEITYEALEDWLSMRPHRTNDGQSPSTVTDSGQIEPTDTSKMLAKIAAAEARIAGLEARLSDTQADRDSWRDEAKRLSEPRPGIISQIITALRR